MRIQLKGIHTVQSKGGTYYYAYRGGPRLVASPGSTAFVEEYRKALSLKGKPKQETTVQGLIDAYQRSTDYTRRAKETLKNYSHYLRLIGIEFGTMPLAALDDPEVRGVFMDWRDSLAGTPRKADYAWQVLSLLFAWAVDRRKIKANPCTKGGRLYTAQRQENIWTEDQVTSFTENASQELSLALLMALWTGQRQGDLLRLPWTAYRDGQLRVLQSKTGANVLIPVIGPLKEVLDNTPQTGETILTGQKGQPWTSSGFRGEWSRTCRKLKINDVTFHDLRGTAVTRLALAGCTIPEIASITGHSLRAVTDILDKHYLGGGNDLARSAMSKLERFVKPGPNCKTLEDHPV